jgi:aminopeptidase N
VTVPHSARLAALRALSGGVIPFEEPGVAPNYTPSRRVRITHLDLRLRVAPTEQRFDGEATLSFEPLALYAGTATFDLDEVEVLGVTDADGAELPWRHRDGALSIEAGDQRAVTVRWHGESPTRGLFFTGPTAAQPDRQHMAWTQCQDEDGHFVFPCHDHPGTKHPWTIRLEGPIGHTQLSNGAATGAGEDGELAWSTWEVAQPMPAYLFSAVFAKLSTKRAEWRGRPVAYHAPVGEDDAVVRSMGKTPLMIEAFSQRTGFDYAWPRYDQVVVHDFIFGGMENVACTTMTDILLVDEKAQLEWDPDVLVAHELAHQWFGNVVTCQDWSQGWLNESWATFMESVWWEHDRTPAEAIWYRFETMRSYLGEYGGRYRRSLVSYRFKEPLDVFDRHLYQKGSTVLWTLRGMLGEEAFWAGVKRYLHDNAHTAVHARDFQRAMERATGENLDGFFHQWVEAPGHPELSVKLEEGDGLVLVTVAQTQTLEGAPEAYRFPLVIEIVTADGARRVKLPVAERQRTWAVPVDGEVRTVRIDPGLNVLATHTWTGPRSWLEVLLTDEDPVVASRAAAALLADGSTAALAAVRRAMDVHPLWAVRADLATKLGQRGGPLDEAALIERLDLDDDPRVRRAAAAALGAFRTSTAADALLAVLDEEVTTWQLTGAALKALGETRDPRAVDAITPFLERDSWAETLRSRALAGLAATRDPAVLDVLVEHTSVAHIDRVRGAAATALATLAKHVEPAKTPAVERLIEMLGEAGFRSQLMAIAALGTIGDARASGPLGRLHRSAPDGRTRRAAYEARVRIDRAQQDGAAIEALRRKLETLESANAELRERLEKLETPDV